MTEYIIALSNSMLKDLFKKQILFRRCRIYSEILKKQFLLIMRYSYLVIYVENVIKKKNKILADKVTRCSIVCLVNPF